jgi:drug/metabolite transporter (DMT)-like permease
MTKFESPPNAARARAAAHLAMLAYAVFIAGSFSFGSLAAPHISPSAINAIRFCAATLLMGGMLVVRNRGRLVVPPALWRFLLLGSLMGIYFILMFFALRITTPVSTSAVFTLIPLMTAILGYFILGQKTRRLMWTSLAVSAVGALWVIFRADIWRLLSFRIGQGELLFFIGCVCQALYAPLVRLLNRGEPVLEFTVWTLAGCTVFVTAFAIPEVHSIDWGGLGLVVWLSIAYLTICSTAISFLLLQYASMHLPAAKIFPYAYLIPTFVIVIEAALGHGLANPLIMVGSLITAAGLLIMYFAP